MKLGILSQWYDPEPGPAAIPGVLAREFLQQGHSVSVLTGFPNYPTGYIYDGFHQRWRSRLSQDGLNLTRVALYPNHDSSASKRLLNYASFAASATVFGAGALRDVDAVWVYNSPVTVAFPLLAHTRWGRTPYFLQVQDLWPDSLIDSGMFPEGAMGRLASGTISRIVRLMENRAVVIGVSSPGARDLILERNPALDPSRIVFSPNPTDETLFTPVDGVDRQLLPTASWRDKFVVMYAGAIGDVQGLESLIDAALALRSKPEIHIVLVGDGIARARLEARSRTLGLTNITFVGRVDKSEVPRYAASSNVQLVSLADRPFLRTTTPSKIASLLASRLPILGQLRGDGADLIEAAGAGIVARPGDWQSLADSVIRMYEAGPQALQQFASSGRRYYDINLAASVVAANIVRSLQAAL